MTRSTSAISSQVTDHEEEGIAIEQASTAQLRKIAKSYQAFDKYLASIRVYNEYKEEEIYQETGLTDAKLES